MPALAEDLQVAEFIPATLSPQLEAERLRPGFAQPELTNDLLAAYVARQQALTTFTAFDEASPSQQLTQAVLLGYIDRTKNHALDAIDSLASQPALNTDVLATYAEHKFVPTVKKVKLATSEKLCLTQAIYHEARGESETGQWAVANVIINRAMSKKYPSTLCGVVFQNADQGFHHCQFTFACDGQSDMGTERGAWTRAARMANAAYQEFRTGDRPGVLPNSALYYHTTAVDPDWSNSFRRVAEIGHHVFYASN
jgi:spore germination cell wall hydrolase CwlJ-like protein